MKKYIAYILTFTICVLSLTGCTEEKVISAGAGADVRQNEQQTPYSTDTAIISLSEDTAAETTETDPEPQQSVEEWEEWECIAERPCDDEENVTITTVSSPRPAPENNDPVPADTTSDDPVNTTPANLNAPLPTMTYASVNSAGEYEYTVQNNTQYEWGYGLEPYFDKYDEEQGVWLPVEPITEITVIEIYCVLQPGGSSNYTLPIDQYYGDLSAGAYRVGLLMRNHKTEMAEMVWYEFSVGIDESYWRIIECN